MITQICATGVAVAFPPGTPNARPRLLLTTQIVLTGLCVYTNGWGALLAVGFVFAAGGVGAVLRELKPLLHLECMTVAGETLAQRLDAPEGPVDRLLAGARPAAACGRCGRLYRPSVSVP